jgi:hypothetical protein
MDETEQRPPGDTGSSTAEAGVSTDLELALATMA